MSFYVLTAVKFALGMLVMILQINILGKYEFSLNTPLNQIQNYVLGGIIGGVIYSPSVTILRFAVVLIIWVLLIIGLRRLKTKSHAIKKFVDGSPIVLIKHGEVDVEACRRAKITAAEVAFKLRREGVYHVRDVKRAVFEQNGELIIVLRGEENPKYPIITDGIVQSSVLDDIDRSEEWLEGELQKAGYSSASEIFLAEYEGGQMKFIPFDQAPQAS